MLGSSPSVRFKNFYGHKSCKCYQKQSLNTHLFKKLFTEMDTDHEQLTNLACQVNLAYLVDIFIYLNKLNMQLQGSRKKQFENVVGQKL